MPVVRTLRAVFVVVGSSLVVLGLPLGSAQPGLAEPVSGCQPEECDPVLVNGGNLTRGAPATLVLFAHLTDLLQPAALDTRPPSGEDDLNAGPTTPSVDTQTGTPADVHFKTNRFVAYSGRLPSPGSGDAAAPSSAMAGLPYETTITGDAVTGFWYLSPNMVPVDDGSVSTGAMPNVGVSMRLHTSSPTSAGVLLAQGDVGPGRSGPSPSGLSSSVTLINLPDGDSVYEFRVVMAVEKREIRAGDGLAWVTDVYQAAAEDGDAAQGGWRVRTGAVFPPRLLVEVAEPMKMIDWNTEVEGRDLVFSWTLAGLWGAYDVDLSSARLSLDGPRPVDEVPLDQFQFGGRPGATMDPLLAKWRYPFHAQGLPDGTYTVEAVARNGQGTYELVWTQELPVSGGQPRVSGTPGPDAGAVLLAALAGLAVAGRRWTRSL